jgi:hypothetical protein
MQATSLNLEIPEHWARVTLVAGKAKVQRWSIDGSKQRARVVVGQDPSCDWHVEAEGVQAGHLALQWNGETLWVVALGEGKARMNGRPLQAPCQIVQTSWIDFGSAVMIAESSCSGRGEARGEAVGNLERQREVSMLLDVSHLQTNNHVPSAQAANTLATRIAPLPHHASNANLRAAYVPGDIPAPVLGKGALGVVADERDRSHVAPAVTPTDKLWQNIQQQGHIGRVLRLLRRHRVRLRILATLASALLAVCLRAELRAMDRPLARATRAITEKRDTLETRPVSRGRPEQRAPAQASSSERRHGVPHALVPEMQARARRASELMFAGRREEALPLYQQLAAQTHEPVFGTIASVLARHVRERCEEREEAGGEPCEP